MIVLEFEQVEIDHCTNCGGVWLDSGELEQLFADKNSAEQMVDAFIPAQDVKEKKHSCPICLKKMEKILAGGRGEPVIIDRCPKYHGLWFDKNELSTLLSRDAFDKEYKMVKLLSEIFSKDKGDVKNDN